MIDEMQKKFEADIEKLTEEKEKEISEMVGKIDEMKDEISKN